MKPATTAVVAALERSPSPEFSPLVIGDDLSPLPEYKAAGDTSLDFGGLLEKPLELHEDLASGCGGQTWPAGMVLAKHMLRYHRDRLREARMSGSPLRAYHVTFGDTPVVVVVVVVACDEISPGAGADP